MSFRGINTTVIQIRRQVFTEVARMAYANVKGEQANHLMRKIPASCSDWGWKLILRKRIS